jgi:hypothetical protein
MAKRIAFFVCGIMTAVIGRLYSGLQQLGPTLKIAWPHFPDALIIVGASAVCISLLPTAWVQSIAAKDTKPHRFTPFRFLLSFAALGLFLVVVFSFMPPSLVRLPISLVYSLCPACVLTATVDPSLTTAVFVLAPMNALVFGAIGGVIGTAFSIITR